MSPLSLALISSSVVIAVVGQFMLKLGMEKVGKLGSFGQLLSPAYLGAMATTWQIPLALILYFLGAVLWMAVLSRERLSYAYPFLGFSYILIMLGGIFFLGEKWTVYGVIGTVLVAVGVVMVAAWG